MATKRPDLAEAWKETEWICFTTYCLSIGDIQQSQDQFLGICLEQLCRNLPCLIRHFPGIIFCISAVVQIPGESIETLALDHIRKNAMNTKVLCVFYISFCPKSLGIRLIESETPTHLHAAEDPHQVLTTGKNAALPLKPKRKTSKRTFQPGHFIGYILGPLAVNFIIHIDFCTSHDLPLSWTSKGTSHTTR